MNPRRTHKKNLIVSYKNLSDELKQLFKEAYPDGYSDYLQRFEKPNGETIFVVPLEAEDAMYMVKFDVKIDTTITDADDDKDFYDEQIDKADEEFAPLSEALDKEENANSHTERSIRHGDYEDSFSTRKKKPSSLSGLGKELEEAFDNDDYDENEYDDDREDEESDEEPDDIEPTDEELMDIDSDFYITNSEVPPEEKIRMEDTPAPAKPKRGRPRKNALPAAAIPAPPKKKGRPRKNPSTEGK